MGFRSFILMLMAITPLLAACGGVVSSVPSDEPSPGVAPVLEYKLAEGEKLRISVAGEERLSGEFVIDPAGTISFPLLGKIQAVGLSSRELEESLTGKLRGRYLVNPKVFVEILSHRPFYVMGEVRNVGEFAFKPGLNVVTAILIAGGYGPRASTSRVYIKRASEIEEKEYPAQASVPVHPGDIVRVPERYF